MTKEQEAIERLNRFKTIEVLYSNTFAMHIEQLKTVQEDIETVLSMLKEKDKRIAKYEKIYKEYDKKMTENKGNSNWVVTDRIVMNVLKELLEENK